MLPEVIIFHTGDNADDKAFAEEIKARIRPFSKPKLIDVDELERQDRAGLLRPEEFNGVPIYVMSPSLLQQPEYRIKLLASMPGQNTWGRNMLGIPVFYVCHDITLQKILDDYPDLDNLISDSMIGDEENLPEMIDGFQQYLADIPQKAGLAQRISQFLMIILAIPIYWLGYICSIVYSFSFISSLWLSCLLMFKLKPPAYVPVLICHVLFASGFSFSRIPSLDLWEYLGPVWKIRDFFEGQNRSGDARTGHPDSEYSDRIHRQTITIWISAAKTARIKQLFAFCFLIVPGLMSAWETNLTNAGVGVFFAGIIIPVLWSASLRVVEKWRSWMYGMSDYEIEHAQSVFQSWPPPTGTNTWTVHRPWLPKSPWILGAQWIQAIQAKVFISHAWKDDDNISVPQDLYEIVMNLHLPCFLDKRGMTSKFANFRSQLANELLTSTHFFVVLGRNAIKSRAVRREIRTAMQRWYTGLEPAIICIVEPELATELMENNTVPEINFLLNHCPKLTYAEASNQDVIKHIIRQRCRHGLLEDLSALVSPASTLRRYLSAEIRSMNQID